MKPSHTFPWKRAESIYDDDGPDGEMFFDMAGHRFQVSPTDETGINTGRTRYFVRCHTCLVTLHEATTGPAHMIESHLDRKSVTGDTGIMRRAERLIPVGGVVVGGAGVVVDAAGRARREPSAVERILDASPKVDVNFVGTLVDDELLSAIREQPPLGADLREPLQESLDWINIRALAAGRIAELLAFTTSDGRPALGMLSATDLKRLQCRVAEWLPGQPPRTQADVHNGHEVARLTRELDKARGVIHGKIRMAKETGEE